MLKHRVRATPPPINLARRQKARAASLQRQAQAARLATAPVPPLLVAQVQQARATAAPRPLRVGRQATQLVKLELYTDYVAACGPSLTTVNRKRQRLR